MTQPRPLSHGFCRVHRSHFQPPRGNDVARNSAGPCPRWRGKGLPGLFSQIGAGLFAILLLVLSPLILPAQADGVLQTKAMSFGQSATISNCMRLTVQGYRDRTGDVENYDWVTVILKNDCTHAVGGMLVELYLVNLNGDLYGRRFWALEPQQALLPGGTRKERFAIPDPDSYSAAAWAMRVLAARKKTLH